MTNPLDRPIVNFLIIMVSSLFAALICARFMDSVARVSGNAENFLGLTFQAGGGLAGFLIIFTLSQKVLERLRRERDMLTIPVSVYVESKTKFDPPASRYKCEATLYNINTGESRILQMQPGLENGAIRFDLRDVLLAEYVSAIISNDQNQQWYLEDFRPLIQTKAAKPLLAS